VERAEALVVGGGQAGPTTSYFLIPHDREHVVSRLVSRDSS